MKLSLQLGSREVAFCFGKTALSSLTQAFIRGDDVGEGGGAALTSAYQQSVWVYACIGALAKQFAQVPLRVSRGDRAGVKQRDGRWRRRATGEDLIESGPLVELLNRPHPQLTRFDFWHLLLAWLLLRGDTFAVPTTETGEVVSLDGPGGGRNIRRLVVLQTDQVRELVSGHALEGWAYQGSLRDPLATVNLLPSEVLSAKLSNPYDFWRGLAPLTVARVAASTDYASAQFMKGLMTNNADTGVIVRTDQQLDPAQREQLLAALRERKRRAGTADRPLLLWGGAEVVKPALSSSDMQFLENRKFNRQEICAVFGVPQEVLGFTEDANRSVSDAARLNFVENTISALCELFEAAIEPLARAYDRNFYAWFDLDALPIMQRARQARFTTAGAAMTTMGVPLNVVNELFDLGLPGDLAHGEAVFLPFSLQEYGKEEPLPGAPAPQAPPEGGTPTAAPEGEMPGEPMMEALGRAQAWLGQVGQCQTGHVCTTIGAYQASIRGSVKLKTGKLRRFFFEQRGRVIAALNAQIVNGVAPEKGFEAKAIEDLFNLGKENAELLARMKKLLIADLQFGGAQLFKEIGLADFAVPPAEAIAFLGKRANEIKGVNATTFDQLKTSLAEGLAAGDTQQELTDRVKAVYTKASDLRAESIALTETNVAINSGRFAAMKAAKVEQKAWLASNLMGSRPTHQQAAADYKTGIPLTEPFVVGGEELLYPGDPAGSAGNVINCRCTSIAVVGGKAAIPVLFLAWEDWLESAPGMPSDAPGAGSAQPDGNAGNVSARPVVGSARGKISTE